MKVYDVLNNNTIDIKCKYLISAEGSKSVIRAGLDPEFENDLKWFFAYQNYYEGSSSLDPNFYHGFLEPQYGEVYAWFSVKNNLQVFGTSAAKSNKIRPFLLRYKKLLESKFDFKLGKLVRKSGCFGNNMCREGKFLPRQEECPTGRRGRRISQRIWRGNLVRFVFRAACG